jgi:16S rRNA (cytosine1402-N4)-methyltransferase
MKLNSHIPVMLKESIKALCLKPDGIYLDCTYGRGGHAKEILKHLGQQGKLIALDRDLDAVNVGKRIKDKRFVIEHCAFSEMDQILKKKILKNWMVF